MKRALSLCIGLALALGAATQAAAPPTETKHLTVAASASGSRVAPGTRVSLALDVTPKPRMHVYAPQQKEYIPISLVIEANPEIKTSVARFPNPEKLLQKNEDEPQLIYSKPFRIVQDVTVASTRAVLNRAKTAGATVKVKGTLKYQACDDAICYLPVTVPVTWTIALTPPAKVTP
jgi:hypothetical protein